MKFYNLYGLDEVAIGLIQTALREKAWAARGTQGDNNYKELSKIIKSKYWNNKQSNN